MTVAASERLRLLGAGRVGLISFNSSDDWTDLDCVDEFRVRPAGWPLRWFGFCRWLSQYDALGIIGADVLDGYYSSSRSCERLLLARTAERMGLRVVLLGFSYRATPDPIALGALKRLSSSSIALCRDPQSLRRVRSMALARAHGAADLAFLLEPRVSSPATAALGAWIRERRAAGDFILGVNCNLQATGRSRTGDAINLVRAHVAALDQLLRRHPAISIVLMPHDSRGTMSDERIVEEIYRGLSEPAKERTRCVLATPGAAEIKAIAAALDAAISGRMHFSIACLGSGTPVASFEYQDKFSGMYELFGLHGLCVPGIDCLDPAVVATLLDRLHSEAVILRKTVSSRLPVIRELSARNISALLGEPMTGHEY